MLENIRDLYARSVDTSEDGSLLRRIGISYCNWEVFVPATEHGFNHHLVMEIARLRELYGPATVWDQYSSERSLRTSNTHEHTQH
jgi:hypothetical protein